MNKSVICIEKKHCTGCGACYNICPVKAITMKPDANGFCFPELDETVCVDCGMCLNVCPAHAPQYDNDAQPNCYAVMAEDAIRAVSSSGGVFSLLADWVLAQDGVVCGAAFTPDYYAVEHIIISEPEQLPLLRGSKYVQSDTKNIYQQVKEHLARGKVVLFTGTPCQVAAMHSFLGETKENLYTLDIVCHGVPSQLVYKRFVEEQERIHNSKATRVSFRDKDIVGWTHSTTIDFANGQTYQKRRNECAYMNSFLNLLTLRESCGNCPFAALPRQGDMTIADFWDVHRIDASLDDHKGTSMVLVNNDKGKKLLEVLARSAALCVKAPLEQAIKYNAQIKYSSLLHRNRSRFFDLLNHYHYDFEKTVDYGLNRRFDIGYVGWWYGQNYGSALTNYALNRVLTAMGKSVLMLEFPTLTGDVPKRKSDNKTRRFANHFYEQSMNCRIEDYGRFNYHCETFLLGSDQLWNWWSNRDVGSYHFFLDFVDDNHKKIAYSTSFGHDSAYYPEEMRVKIGYLLRRFDAISVRESGGVMVCKRDYDLDVVQTVDPVFLCSVEAYEEAIALSTVNPKEQYVLAYILNPTEEKIDSVRYIAKQKNMPYHIILDGQADYEQLKAQTKDENVLGNIEIADWLAYFKYASYVVTDSFHGFCYSIIYRHDMTVFPNSLRGLSRFESLCQMTGLTDRMVNSLDDMIHKAPWKVPVDFDRVAQLMQPKIDFSENWLKSSLEMEKVPSSFSLRVLKALLQTQEQLKVGLQARGKNNSALQTKAIEKKHTLRTATKAFIACSKYHGFGYTICYAFKKIKGHFLKRQ